MMELTRAVPVFTIVMLVGSVAGAASQEPGAAPAPRQIPGVTAPDQFPRGCVDCHVNRPDLGMDVRLSTLIRQWQAEVAPEFLARVRTFSPAGMPLEGKHPEVGGDVARVAIPTTCLQCHSRTSKLAPPFSQLLHGLHLTGAENHFLSMFQGECTHCHKLDTATGLWSVGSGTEER